MYNKVFKSNQIKITTPYKINPYINYGIERRSTEGQEEESPRETPEETKANINQFAEEIIRGAKENAGLIINEATLEADRMMREAENEIQRLKSGASENGFNEGFEKATSEAKSQYEALIRDATELKEKAAVDYEKTLAEAELEIVRLAMAVAKKAIGEELKNSETVILALVRDALRRTASKDNLLIKVSKEDYGIVNDNFEQEIVREMGLGEVDLKASSALRPGDVQIETPYGVIDGGVSSKLAKVEEQFEILLNEELDEET